MQDQRAPGTGARLNLTIAARGKVMVITPRGEIDLTSARIFEGCLLSAAGECDEPLIVDLRNVSFMDSTGLHALCRAQQELQTTGRRITVCNPIDSVRKLFEVTGMAETFGIDGSDPVWRGRPA
jgi:anti-anti-sigma factor